VLMAKTATKPSSKASTPQAIFLAMVQPPVS